MKTTTLHWKRMALPVLLVLLLSAVGLTNAMAQTFTVGNFNYSLNDDGVSVTVIGHVDGTNATGELVIPESVEQWGNTYTITFIGENAFDGCSNISSVTIGSSVTTIGCRAFRGCYGLTSITIPSNVTFIYCGAFCDCTNLTVIQYDAIHCSMNNSWCGEGHWMAGCSSLNSIIIGNNVQVIPDGFAEGFNSLTSVSFGNSVISIGNNAFHDCSNLSGELIIPNSVTSIGDNAFENCSGYSQIILGNNVDYIGNNAFKGCSGFTGPLTIPSAVTTIGSSAFMNCTSFSGTLTLGQSLTEIYNSAFFGSCEGFTSINITAEIPPTLGNNVFVSANYGIPVQVPCGTLDAYQNAQGWNVFTNIQETNPCLWEITATAIPNAGGTISGTGSYEQGTTCTLTATALGDFEFNRWTENGVTVSTDAVYSFTVENHRNLVAQFINPNFIIFADPTVEARCVELWDTDGDGYLSYNEAAAVTNLDYAFQYWGITSFDELQYFTGLTSLNDYEFYDCESLTSITLPENITYIGYYAFAYCYSLSSINLLSVTPPGLNWCAFCEIYSNNNIIISVPCGATGNYQNNDGWNVFSNYYEPGDCIYEIVATANIEEGGTVNGAGSYQRGQTCTLIATANEGRNFVHWIENSQEVSTDATYSFTVMGPRNLVAVFSALASEIIVFADPNVEAICVANWDIDGDGALCYSEAAIVTDLGSAFQYNENITSFDELQFFTGLTSIRSGAFQECSNLTSIILPEGITSIGSYAFSYCSGLTGDLFIPNSVTELGYAAFYHCEGYNGSLTIGANVNYMHDYAFAYTNFSTLNYNAVNCETVQTLWIYRAEESVITLNIGENVESIPNFVFQDFPNVIGDLLIPNSVTSIGKGAFRFCISLNSITIGNSVTSIGNNAFNSCSGLTSIIIGNSVTSIGNYAFQNCSGLYSVVIPNSVIEIGYYAFNNCSSLTSTNLPDGLTFINEGVFADCSSLASVTFPSSLETIGNYAFQNCNSLTSLELPNTITSIGSSAFSGCSGLIGTLELPASITTINEAAFYDCIGLESIILPENINSIGGKAFRNCSGLRGELTLPESLESVGGYAFYGCDGISTVNYNATNCQTMGSAGEPVFYDCAFEHIRIGENVQSIPNYAFKHCFLVKDIASAAVNPPTIYSSTFGMVSRNIPVSVPMGSGEAYRTAQYWEEFFHITEDYSPSPYTYHWSVNVHQFGDNMTVTGIIQIEGVEQSVPSLEIGAFCNGECRGRQLLTYYPQVDRYLVFLMLYGEDGDVFTFRLYDHEAGEELTAGCASVITFEADAIVGSFLDPYVFNFTDMQLTQFSEGWNWWSTYVEQAGIDGLSLLQESLGDNGVAIRSQASGYTDYYAGYGWYGSLESINNESSYRVVTSAPCVAAMPGSVAIPSQHPITLSQGWTWIGYLPSRAMDINTALEGLEATQGDMVKSQQGYSDYYPGYGWFGSLNTVEPGMGLMYYSTNGETITFTYPDNTRSGELKQNLTAEYNHWKPNTFAYPDNMTVMATIELDGEELNSDYYELAAFANGECRGSVKLAYAEPLHRHVAFLTISGKDAAELSFRLYDTETGMEYYDAEESLDFVTNAIVGMADDLYTIHFRGTTGMDEFASKVQVYPNPVNAGERFSINVADDVKTPVHVEIVNALGVETLRATSVQTLTAPNVAGVYTLRITVEGKGTVVQKLVVK